MPILSPADKPPIPETPRELIVACAPMRSNVNLSHIVAWPDAAACKKLICCGNATINAKIARDGGPIPWQSTVPPPLDVLKSSSVRLQSSADDEHVLRR